MGQNKPPTLRINRNTPRRRALDALNAIESGLSAAGADLSTMSYESLIERADGLTDQVALLAGAAYDLRDGVSPPGELAEEPEPDLGVDTPLAPHPKPSPAPEPKRKAKPKAAPKRKAKRKA